VTGFWVGVFILAAFAFLAAGLYLIALLVEWLYPIEKERE
jgi:hypothetical protein